MEEAVVKQHQVVVFPEAFLPGYPHSRGQEAFPTLP
jgi:predicted amidohydrolase